MLAAHVPVVTFCCCTVSMSSFRLTAADRVIRKLSFPQEVRLALLNSFGRTLFRAGGGALATPPPCPACTSTTIFFFFVVYDMCTARV